MRGASCRQPSLSLAAHQRPAVEVNMVVMRRVVFGAQHHPEIPAGAGVGGAQEARFRSVPAPVAAYADLAPVSKREAAYVHRIGSRVLAAPILPERIADDVAAGKGAIALH